MIINVAAATQLFVKTIQCRNFCHGTKVSLLKIRDCQDFLVIKRGKIAKPNLIRLRPKEVELPRRKDDHIGLFGYLLLGMPITAFILGCWQIQRHKWKLALIEDLQRRVNSPPVQLPEDLSELENMEYHPVKVRGRFLHDKEFTIGPRSLIIKGAGASEMAGGVLTPGRSNTGFYIVTPFQLEDRDLTIMVNRGWVPVAYKKNRREAKTQSNDVVELTGVVRLTEKRPPFVPKNSPSSGSWMYRDLEAMAEYAGTAPIYIELLAKETVRGGPIAGQTRITLRNEHLSYIFTWYSLAVITAWMWHRQYIKRLPLM